MKIRTLMIALGLVTAIGLTGCGGESTSAPAPADDAEQVEEVAEEVKGESKDTTKGDIHDYYVELGDCHFGKDIDGKDVIVITYKFTNNSDEAISPFGAVWFTAYQDGIQLENAIVGDRNVFDSETEWKNVKPGYTLEGCQTAYVLTSNSTVELEVGDMFNGDILTKTFEVE